MFSEFATSGRVVVFDTETTGGSCSDEICQLAAAEYINGRLERTMNVYIRPTCEMNPWAEQVHGISMDYLDEHGIDPVDALHQFFHFLGSDVLLVAHNNRFDLKMLQQECAKFDCAFESDAGIEKVNPFSPSTPSPGSADSCRMLRSKRAATSQNGPSGPSSAQTKI